MKIKSQFTELHKYRVPIFMLFIFCMMATFSFLAASNMEHSNAASMSGFSAGNIMSDAVMSNYNSMSKDAIQQFLTSKNPCNNRNYSQYQSLKKQYPNTNWHWENDHFVCLSEERFGDGTAVGQGQTAAEIIYQAAQDYKINPQVLIVLLEKEQGLITDSFPNSVQYRSATGYGCPDTSACNTKYYGFKNQVRNAAALFRNVLDNGYSVYPEKRSGVYVRFSPNASCGSSEVYIENRATAALYRYTPYQPNAAAIAANYGTGDICSAYGNRNFYLYFTDWFGDTHRQYIEGEEFVLPDGVYGLASKSNSTRSISVAKSAKTKGSNVQLEDNKNNTSNKWQFTRDSSTGYYTIVNINSGLALDVNGGTANSGTNLQLWEKNSTCAQRWRIYRTSDNYLTFESACSPGMVVDLSGNNTANGSNIQVWAYSSTSNAQKWSLYTGPILSDGTYALKSKAKPGNKVIDVSNNGAANGTNIQVWTHYIPAIAQKWNLKYDTSTDSYVLTNPASNKAIDVSGGSMAQGNNVQLWDSNSTCAQRWKVVEYEKGYYGFISTCNYSRALDVSGGYPVDGTNLQIWNTNGTDAQKWQLQPLTQVIADGLYSLAASGNQNRAIDVNGGYTTIGTNIQLWNRNGTDAQKWQFTYDKKQDAYTLTNPRSGKVLYLADRKTNPGTNIQLGTADGSCAQYWKISQNSDSSYVLTSACDKNRSLDLFGGYTHYNGVNLQLWESNGTAAQKMVPLSAVLEHAII